MRINRSLLALPAALMLAGATGAIAQNVAQPAKPMTSATHTITTTQVDKKPMAAPKVTQTARRSTTTAAAQPGGRMVTAKTTTGKTITYDCSKAGNKSKKACKA